MGKDISNSYNNKRKTHQYQKLSDKKMKNKFQNRRKQQLSTEEIQEAGACTVFSRLTGLITCELKLQGPYFNEVGSQKWENAKY